MKIRLPAFRQNRSLFVLLILALALPALPLPPALGRAPVRG